MIQQKETKISCKHILGIINDLTNIHNALAKNQIFNAGFELGSLQTRMVLLMKDLEEQEKRNILYETQKHTKDKPD